MLISTEQSIEVLIQKYSLEENPDSNAIIQKLSEQYQEFQGNISSETESETSNSEDEE